MRRAGCGMARSAAAGSWGFAVGPKGTQRQGALIADLIVKAQKGGAITRSRCLPRATRRDHGHSEEFKMKLTNAIPDGTSAQENRRSSRRRAERAPTSRPRPSLPDRRSRALRELHGVDLVDHPPTSSMRAELGATNGARAFAAPDVAKTVPKNWGTSRIGIQEHVRARRRPAPAGGPSRRVRSSLPKAARSRPSLRHPVFAIQVVRQLLKTQATSAPRQGQTRRVRMGLPPARRRDIQKQVPSGAYSRTASRLAPPQVALTPCSAPRSVPVVSNRRTFPDNEAETMKTSARTYQPG